MGLPIPTRSNGDDVITSWWNELVTEINNIWNGVTALKHVTLDWGGTPPAVAPSGDARAYYDGTKGLLMLSRDGNAYTPLAVAGTASDSSGAQETTTSPTLVTTTVSFSFTPKSATSTIVLIAQVPEIGALTTTAQPEVVIARDGTDIAKIYDGVALLTSGQRDGMRLFSETSPGTSAVTYAIYHRRVSGTGTVALNKGGDAYMSLAAIEVESAS